MLAQGQELTHLPSGKQVHGPAPPVGQSIIQHSLARTPEEGEPASKPRQDEVSDVLEGHGTYIGPSQWYRSSLHNTQTPFPASLVTMSHWGVPGVGRPPLEEPLEGPLPPP